MEQYIDTTGTSARMVDLTRVGLTVQAALVQKTEEIDTRVPQAVFAITADNNTVQAVADQTGFAKTDEIILPHRDRESIEVSAKTESEIGRVTKDITVDIQDVLASIIRLGAQLEKIIKKIQMGDGRALRELLNFSDNTAAREEGLRLATTVSNLMVMDYAVYKEAEWSEDALKTAMPLQSPSNAFVCFDIYQHIDGAEEILETATKEIPAVAIEQFHRYAGSDETPSTLAIRILRAAAEARPELAIQHFKKYAGGHDNVFPPDSLARPKWAIDILRQAAKRKPDIAIRDYGLYQSFLLRIENGENSLEVDPERQEILKEAAAHDPNTAIEYSDRYLRDPDSRKILNIAVNNTARRNPTLAIRKNVGMIDDTLVEEWIDSNPQAAIEYLNHFSPRDLSCIRIIKKLLRKHPLISTGAIQSQDNVRVALDELSQENPLFYIRKLFT